MPDDHLLTAGEPGGIDDVDVWLMATVAMIPMAAAVALIVAFHSTKSAGIALFIAFLVGVLLTIVIYRLYTLFHFNEAKHASVDTYNDLCNRMDRVVRMKMNLRSDSDPSNVAATLSARVNIMQTVGAFKFFRRKKGVHWVLGKGYLDLLRLVHRCEEAMFMYQPVDLVMFEAAKDRRRLIGANTPQREDLINQLYQALVLLDPSAMHTLTDLESQNLAMPPKGARPAEVGLKVAPELGDCARRTLARQMLRDVRFAVNEFRDASRARLMEARNNLVARMFLTALTTSLLVIFVVIAIDPQFDYAVLAGAVLYAVGAMVGLFSRLYADLSKEAVGGDYGFSHVRLFQTFLVSGLAGVAGVYVAVALPVLGSQLPRPSSGQPGSLAMPELMNIFNLQAFPAAIFFAAIFGLAPGLLFDRLWGTVEQYRENLKSSEPTPPSAASSNVTTA